VFDRSAANVEHLQDFPLIAKPCISRRHVAILRSFDAFLPRCSASCRRTLRQRLCKPRFAASDSLENKTMATEKVTMESLALRPREAAKALGVSERSLWEWTHRGDVPHVRIGRTIMYPVDSLREWLNRQANKAKGGEQDAR
jgi:excisionase family DNA binding protein